MNPMSPEKYQKYVDLDVTQYEKYIAKSLFDGAVSTKGKINYQRVFENIQNKVLVTYRQLETRFFTGKWINDDTAMKKLNKKFEALQGYIQTKSPEEVNLSSGIIDSGLKQMYSVCNALLAADSNVKSASEVRRGLVGIKQALDKKINSLKDKLPVTGPTTSVMSEHKVEKSKEGPKEELLSKKLTGVVIQSVHHADDESESENVKSKNKEKFEERKVEKSKEEKLEKSKSKSESKSDYSASISDELEEVDTGPKIERRRSESRGSRSDLQIVPFKDSEGKESEVVDHSRQRNRASSVSPERRIAERKFSKEKAEQFEFEIAGRAARDRNAELENLKKDRELSRLKSELNVKWTSEKNAIERKDELKGKFPSKTVPEGLEATLKGKIERVEEREYQAKMDEIADTFHVVIEAFLDANKDAHIRQLNKVLEKIDSYKHSYGPEQVRKLNVQAKDLMLNWYAEAKKEAPAFIMQAFKDINNKISFLS